MWSTLSFLVLASIFSLTGAMPTMYTTQTIVHTRIIHFANHAKMIVRETVIKIVHHCGRPFTPQTLALAMKTAIQRAKEMKQVTDQAAEVANKAVDSAITAAAAAAAASSSAAAAAANVANDTGLGIDPKKAAEMVQQAATSTTAGKTFADFSVVEAFTGFAIISLIASLILFALWYIGTFLYTHITARVEYEALKQSEAEEDIEANLEPAAPAYVPRPDIAL